MEREINKSLKQFSEIFKDAQETGKKEADVVMYLVQFFKDVLGYDVFKEISKEYQIKERYCDIAIKIDGQIVFLVEVKQAGIRLAERHIAQAETYALKSGTEWVVLTNGVDWQLYHLNLESETGVERSLVLRTDLGKSYEADPLAVARKFQLLHKKKVLKGELSKFWEKELMLQTRPIVSALFTEDVLRAVARELNRGANVKVGHEDLVKGMKRLFDKEVLAELADIKVKKRKRPPRKKAIPKENKKGLPAEPVASGDIKEKQGPSEE